MENRKSRRTIQRSEPKMKKSAKKQLIFMIIAIFLMVFSVTQVYYLARYTLGFDISQEKLKVYRCVYMLLEDNAATEE